MQCKTPLQAQRCKAYDGSYYISFTENNPEAFQALKLPCGQCMGCRLERSRTWAVRCMHEAQLHPHNIFLTLTFNDQNLNANYSLQTQDFQNFMKRLRKRFYSKKFARKYPNFHSGKIRYFHCGEYGDNFSRPHHHACLFNLDFPDKKLYKRTRDGHNLYSSQLLDELWQGQGYAYFGAVTFESAAYVARYCTKKINGQAAEQHYQGRKPEYMTCSKNPAIGLDWIKKFISDAFPSDFIIMNGKKMRPARYYEKYLEKTDNEAYILLKQTREETEFIEDADRLLREYEVQQLRQQTISRTLENSTKLNTYDIKALEFLKNRKHGDAL